MIGRRPLIASLAFVLLDAKSEEDTLDQLPPWDYSELVRAATTGIDSSAMKTVRLLAWHTQEDGRPLRFDAALMWVHVEVAGGEKWMLVKLSRSPTEDGIRKEWAPTFEGHEWQPVKVFGAPPKNAEVYAFLKEHWEFNPDSRARPSLIYTPNGWKESKYTGFRILRAGVRRETWRKVVGEEPTQFHRGERRL